MANCKRCGGTGDAWDDETNDWTDPPERCGPCKGWGEVPPYGEDD